MKYVLCVSILLLATLSMAQQQKQPPPASPPYATPPTFPQEPRVSPPDEQETPSQTVSAEQVEHQIQQSLNSEPTLSNTNVGVKADEDSVVLNGTVATEQQHDLVLRIAQSQAGDRKIVDKIKLRQQT